MLIFDLDYIRTYLTNNQKSKVDSNGKEYIENKPVPYRWTHGATDLSLGDGLLVYSIIHYMRAKICVCLGSGGGFIPRIMTQSRVDLYDSDIFDGNRDYNWGDIGATFIVDADNGIGGNIDWKEENSFFRKTFYPRVILDTTENAYYNFFVKEDIKIDYLHIDAGHSYEDIERDFTLYSQRLNEGGMIAIHDTDSKYEQSHIIPNDIKEEHHQSYTHGPNTFIKEIQKNKEWEVFNFFNHKPKANNPSSTGLTFLQKRKIK